MAATAPEAGDEARVGSRGRRRVDSLRNREALLVAAREVFAVDGVHGSLEEIARRAGVGIGTLYRNFPNREALFEAVYADEVETLARVADELDGYDPWDALATWLRRFVGYATTKKAIYEALNFDRPMFATYIERIHRAGEPLLERAQVAGRVRADVSFDDVRLLINGVGGANYADDAQRERVLTMALDGIKAQALPADVPTVVVIDEAAADAG